LAGGGVSLSQDLYPHRTTQTQNKHTQASTPRVEFEPTIPAFEGAKTVQALEGAATVIGTPLILRSLNVFIYQEYGFLVSDSVWSERCVHMSLEPRRQSFSTYRLENIVFVIMYNAVSISDCIASDITLIAE
jgi:hypothetical protein